MCGLSHSFNLSCTRYVIAKPDGNETERQTQVPQRSFPGTNPANCALFNSIGSLWVKRVVETVKGSFVQVVSTRRRDVLYPNQIFIPFPPSPSSSEIISSTLKSLYHGSWYYHILKMACGSGCCAPPQSAPETLTTSSPVIKPTGQNVSEPGESSLTPTKIFTNSCEDDCCQAEEFHVGANKVIKTSSCCEDCEETASLCSSRSHQASHITLQVIANIYMS